MLFRPDFVQTKSNEILEINPDMTTNFESIIITLYMEDSICKFVVQLSRIVYSRFGGYGFSYMTLNQTVGSSFKMAGDKIIFFIL